MRAAALALLVLAGSAAASRGASVSGTALLPDGGPREGTARISCGHTVVEAVVQDDGGFVALGLPPGPCELDFRSDERINFFGDLRSFTLPTAGARLELSVPSGFADVRVQIAGDTGCARVAMVAGEPPTSEKLAWSCVFMPNTGVGAYACGWPGDTAIPCSRDGDGFLCKHVPFGVQTVVVNDLPAPGDSRCWSHIKGGGDNHKSAPGRRVRVEVGPTTPVISVPQAR